MSRQAEETALTPSFHCYSTATATLEVKERDRKQVSETLRIAGRVDTCVAGANPTPPTR